MVGFVGAELPQQSLGAALVEFGRHKAAQHKFLRAMNAVSGNIGSPRIMGSISYSFAQLAAGRTDALITLNKLPWDVLPGMLLATEAGATATDFSGNLWNERTDELVIANLELGAQIIRQLQSQS